MSNFILNTDIKNVEIIFLNINSMKLLTKFDDSNITTNFATYI